MGKRGFRVNDKVTVHGTTLVEGAARGRVIVTNRKSLYNQSLGVLVDTEGSEMLEWFCPDGTKYASSRDLHITLGWPNE